VSPSRVTIRVPPATMTRMAAERIFERVFMMGLCRVF
jgi:hypothetical protein